MRTIHTHAQGSDAWHAHRAAIFNASEAPAVMGASKFVTRNELLRQKKTGIRPEVSSHQQAIYDRGHAVEAPTVALIEHDIADSLAPVVASIVIDGMTLGASYDGLSLLEDTGAEIKLWNEELVQQIQRGELEPHYFWQLEHQFIVTPSLERIIFATSDGTRERFAAMEYRPVPGRREELLAAWRQFDADLAAYVPPEVVDVIPITPRGPDQLPALRSSVKGELVLESNIKEWEEAALAYIKSVRDHELKTDEDFASADAAAKWCDSSKLTLQGVKASLMSATGDVNTAVATLDRIVSELDKTRIAFTNAIKARKEARKGEIVAGAIGTLKAHVDALNKRLGKPYMPASAATADFGGAIRGKSSLTKMQDAVDTLLANAKIAANDVADRIDANLKALRELASEHAFLFADTAQLVLKAPDDCRAVITSRIAEHQEKVQREAEAAAERERAKIRAEEEARARAKAEQEQREREAAERRQREEAEAAQRRQEQEAAARELAQAQQTPSGAELSPAAQALNEQQGAERFAKHHPSIANPTAANVVPMPTKARSAQPTLALGTIKEHLAPLTITAEGLRTLGFEPAGRQGAAVLYLDDELPYILTAAIQHLTKARDQLAKAA